MIRAMSAVSVTRSEICAEAKAPNRAANVERVVVQGRPGGLELGGQGEEVEGGGDAVLVAHRGRVDEVAERFLVAVGEVRHRGRPI